MQSKKEYYEIAQTWRDEIYQCAKLRLRWSIALNIALLTLLLLSSLILLALIPLKKTVPYVISHNQTTGEITQLGQLNPADYQNDWTLIRYFIIRYITHRESYHSDNIDRPYQIAYAMSDKSIAENYDAAASSSNPRAPYNVYGQNKFVTVEVKSIAKLNENTAEVHFEKTIHDKGSGQEIKIPMVVILKWRFAIMPATQKALDRNPLGFLITYYQPSQVNI